MNLQQDWEAQRLHTNLAVQSLQLMSAELATLTERLSGGRGIGSNGNWGDRGDEEGRGCENENEYGRKRTRATGW
jgi:hypothetical protein